MLTGARYWELSLDRELYFRSWIGTTLQLDCQGCPELPVKVEALAPVVHVGLCAPELCSAGEVREELLSRALEQIQKTPELMPVGKVSFASWERRVLPYGRAYLFLFPHPLTRIFDARPRCRPGISGANKG